MLIAAIVSAIIGAVLGSQSGGAGTQTPAQTVQQVFVVMNGAVDRHVDESRKAEAKRLLGEIEKQINAYHRSTLRLQREAFWRVDSDYTSTADDYAPVVRRFDDGWVGLLFHIADKRDALAELLTDDEWTAFNEEIAEWYATQRPKLMQALDVDDVEDARSRAIAGAARVVSP